MLLVFVDETSDAKYKDYLGFCIAQMNSKFYPKIKSESLGLLQDHGWDPAIEFKRMQQCSYRRTY